MRKEFFSRTACTFSLRSFTSRGDGRRVTASLFVLTAHWWHSQESTCFRINLLPFKDAASQRDPPAVSTSMSRHKSIALPHDKRFAASLIPKCHQSLQSADLIEFSVIWNEDSVIKKKKVWNCCFERRKSCALIRSHFTCAAEINYTCKSICARLHAISESRERQQMG